MKREKEMQQKQEEARLRHEEPNARPGGSPPNHTTCLSNAVENLGIFCSANRRGRFAREWAVLQPMALGTPAPSASPRSGRNF